MTEAFTAQPFGRYTLVGHIAFGGMAEIFRARHEGPAGFSRDLVIKRILPEFVRNTEFVEMFLDEARLVAQLSHPNIVQIHDFGEVDGSYFMAMELVAGPNLGGVLKAAIEQQRTIPLRIAAKICAGGAEGLHYAHHLTGADDTPLNIVHRDISTSNVLVTLEGVPKILDFGIAKAATQSHKTATGLIKGKLGYMPPEQVRSLPLDGRADLYALGVILYRLVTSGMPYRADSEFDLMQAICAGGYTPASQLRPDVPPDLDRIIAKAMALDPGDRYQSGRDLCAALDRFCLSQGEPVSAFDVAELIADLAKNASEPISEIGVPGSSKMSAPPESLGGSGTQATAEMSDAVPTPPGLQTALTPLAHEPPTGAPPTRRWNVALIATALVACVGVAIGAKQMLAGAEGSDAVAPAEDTTLADPPSTATPAPPAAATAAPAPSEAPSAESTVEPAAPEATAKASKPARKKRRGKRRKAGSVREPATAEPQATAAPSPADATPATLRFIVKPWGKVFVDGTVRGTTPIAPLKLAPGRHQVRVVQPDTGKSIEKTVELDAGASETLRFDLTQ